MDIELLKTILTFLVIPVVAFMLSHYEKRNIERGRTRDDFNLLILEGFEAIGGVAIQSAYAIKNQKFNGELEEAIKGYERFHIKVEEFSRQRTKEAVSV